VTVPARSLLQKKTLLLLIGVGVLSLVLSWQSRGFYPLFGFNDDANYYLDALHLQAGEFDLKSRFLPGQALMLLLWQSLFGTNFQMFQAGALLVSAFTSVLIYLTVRDARDRTCAVYATSLYLLTPGVILHSTTLMSEVLFGFQMWLVLRLLQVAWKREDARGYLLTILAGLVLGWSVCTRSQGYFLVGGLGLGHLFHRRFKDLALLAGSTAAGIALLYPLARKSFQVYGGFALTTMDLSPKYLYEWTVGMVRLWSDYLFEFPLLGVPNRTSAVLVVVIALVSCIGFASRWRRLGLLEFVALCYFGGHILWRFLFARYWIAFWPLLAMFLWDAYGWFKAEPRFRRLRPLLFAALLALIGLCIAVDVAALGLARRNGEVYQQRLELFRACRQVVPEQGVLATRFSAQARILSERATVQLPAGGRFAEVVFGLANSPADFVLVDRDSEPILGIGGVESIPYPPGFEYRLEASQLFRQRYIDKWGSVYELTFDKATYLQAFELFVEAERLTSQGQNEAALARVQASLELVPDIPEARFLRAHLLNILGRPEALEDIEKLLEKNPAYPELTLGLAKMLQAQGRTEAARRNLERALKVAQVQRYGAVVEAASAALDRLPTEKAPANGGGL
jgi:tetratricopeptide (TPR) repeat protein